MKIFWSWQSDSPGKTGRHFIRDALDAAVAELKRDLTVDERNEQEAVDAIHIDQDREGLTGSFDLAREILNKIAESDIILADVTSVGISDPAISSLPGAGKAKRHINSNVALELGYAYHALNNNFVFLIMNDHYGVHEDLPFDLRHKGGAIVFTLAPDATRTEIDKVTKSLTKRLTTEFKTALAKKLGAMKAPPAAPAITPVTPPDSAVMFFQSGEVLASAGEPGEQDFTYKEKKAAYLRLFPAQGNAPGLSKVVQEFQAGRAMPLSERSNGIVKRNKYGAITFDFQGRDTLTDFTQGFSNGELWGVNGFVVKDHTSNGVGYTIIPVITFEKIFVKTLRNYVAIAERVYSFKPPFTVIMGVTGLKNTYLTAPGGEMGTGQQIGPIYEPMHQRTETLTATDDDSIKEVLRRFFAGLYDLSAVSRDQILTDSYIAAHDLPPRTPKV
jgi:hypothetical protein